MIIFGSYMNKFSVSKDMKKSGPQSHIRILTIISKMQPNVGFYTY